MAGRFHDEPAMDMERALARVGETWQSATVAVVAGPLGLVKMVAALSGETPVDLLCEDIHRNATRRACHLALLAPPGLPIRHLVVDGWGAVRHHARQGAYDAVILFDAGRMRTRWWTRWPMRAGEPDTESLRRTAEVRRELV